MKRVTARKILKKTSRHVVVEGLFPYMIDYMEGEYCGMYCVKGKRVVKKIDRFKYNNMIRSGRYAVSESDGLEVAVSRVKEDYGLFDSLYKELNGIEEE